MSRFIHVLLTRFNVPGFVGPGPPDDDWLAHRCELFERVCLPSVRGQSVEDFHWLILFARSTPAIYRERIRDWAEWGPLIPCFLDTYAGIDPAALIQSRVGHDAPYLITTRLDNDDGLAVNFVAEVQLRFRSQSCQLINFDHGVVLADGRTYVSYQPSNPFLSLIEEGRSPRTVWCDEHQRLGRRFPTDHVGGHPMWVQTIHAHNASNTLGRAMRIPRRQIEGRFDIDRSLLCTDESRFGLWSENARVRAARHLRGIRRLFTRTAATAGATSEVGARSRLPGRAEVSPPTRPRFAVIVPTRDRPLLLRRALASLSKQTWSDFEVRVVDDGSHDPEAVASAVDDHGDERVQLHRLEPARGVSSARNHGIAVALGGWLTFLDDDDEFRPDTLEQIHDHLMKRPELHFTWAGVRRTYEDGRPSAEVVWTDRSTDALAHLGAGTGYALTIHREAFNAIGGFDESLHAGVDFELLIRLGQHFRGAPLSRVLVDVHGHSASQITDATQAKAESFLNILQKHQPFFARHPDAARAFLLKTARLCHHVGKRAESRQLILRALRTSPWHRGTWKTFLALQLPTANRSRR